MHLNDLDNYTLLNIFEWLNFESSINLAESDGRFQQLFIDHVIQPKFKLHERVINIQKVPFHRRTNDIIEISNDRITINRAENVYRILRSFGNLITKIEFDAIAISFNRTEVAQIAQYINAFCSASLQSLLIKPRNGDLFVDWSKPFENVENLTLFGAFVFGNIPFEQLFPRIRVFNVKLYHLSYDNSRDLSFLERRLPNLTHLTVDIGLTNTKNPSIKEFLRLNPQIRYFATKNFVNVQFLQFMSETLPYLEELKLGSHDRDFLSENSQLIHFDGVKRFSLGVYRDRPPITFPLIFQHLESLHLTTHELFEPFIEAMSQCNDLKQLEIDVAQPDFMQLKRILESLPHLNEVRVPLEKNVDGNGISGIFAEPTQLKTIAVKFFTNTGKREQLLAKMPAYWKSTGEIILMDELMETLTFTRISKAFA